MEIVGLGLAVVNSRVNLIKSGSNTIFALHIIKTESTGKTRNPMVVIKQKIHFYCRNTSLSNTSPKSETAKKYKQPTAGFGEQKLGAKTMA